MKTISLCLVAVLALNTYSLAYFEEPQPNTSMAVASDAKQIEKVKTAIQQRGTGPNAKVKIRMRDKTERKGYISQIEDTSFQLTDQKTGQTAAFAYDSVEKVSGPGLSKAARIVIFVGVGAAAAAIILGVLASKLNHS